MVIGLAAMVCYGMPAAAQMSGSTLGQAGYLIIEGVRDSTSAFAWHSGPKPAYHSLVWPEGTLSLPDSVSLEDFGPSDVGTACLAQLSGVGNSGRLVFEDGIYSISEPLLLADGVLELHVSGGELEVRGTQIRYRRPHIEETSQKANLIFLSGLVLLIVVLMRRARKKLRAS